MIDTITQVADAMQTVLDEVPEAQAGPTGFCKRRRKLTAPVFVKTLVFGWLANPLASLDELAGVAASLGVAISPQALDERLTSHAADLLHRVLQASIGAVIAADPVPLAVLARFTEVILLDSSTISLPEALRSEWAGCGTSNPEAGNAAVKISVAWDLKTGRLRGPTLESARVNDKNTTAAQELPPAGALRVADLGYFRIGTLAEIDRHGGFFLSRFQPLTVVFDAAGRRWSSLAAMLAGQGPRVDTLIRLGARDQLPCRLIAAEVPAAVAQQRVDRSREEATKDGRRLSPECVALARWTVLVTNVPADRLGVEEALAIGRARWQIELLFKLWKGQGRIDEFRSVKPSKVRCELYAKLVAMVVQHWVMLVSSWEHVDRSVVKVCRTIRRHAGRLAEAVGDRAGVARVIQQLRAIVGAGCRINKRKKRPNTCHRLLNLGSEGLT